MTRIFRCKKGFLQAVEAVIAITLIFAFGISLLNMSGPTGGEWNTLDITSQGHDIAKVFYESGKLDSYLFNANFAGLISDLDLYFSNSTLNYKFVATYYQVLKINGTHQAANFSVDLDLPERYDKGSLKLYNSTWTEQAIQPQYFWYMLNISVNNPGVEHINNLSYANFSINSSLNYGPKCKTFLIYLKNSTGWFKVEANQTSCVTASGITSVNITFKVPYMGAGESMEGVLYYTNTTSPMSVDDYNNSIEGEYNIITSVIGNVTQASRVSLYFEGAKEGTYFTEYSVGSHVITIFPAVTGVGEYNLTTDLNGNLVSKYQNVNLTTHSLVPVKGGNSTAYKYMPFEKEVYFADYLLSNNYGFIKYKLGFWPIK